MNPTGSIAGSAFSTVLLPGLMAVAIMFSGIAAVALPLAQEFGITREIDDRVMCPLPVPAVAMEKICFSAVQSVIAACVVFPLAYYVPATHPVTHVSSWPFLILVVALASLTAGALGLTIGTSVKPQQIGLIFGVVVIPITFLGCVYYPWAALTHIRWLQVLVLINPIRIHERRPSRIPHAGASAHESRPDSMHAPRLVLPAHVAWSEGFSAPRHRLMEAV
jgi:ABC-2 type transport system permease protein